MIKRLHFLLLFILSTCFAYAQQGTVSGYVYDAEQVPIENASVYVNDERVINTNEDGYYKVAVELGKQVELRIVFSNSSQLYSVFPSAQNPNFKKNFTFILDHKLDDAVVKPGQRAVTQVGTISVDPRESVKMPTLTFEQTLAAQGIGISIRNELSSAYNVRGGNFDENLIYVNDVEVYRPFLARSGQQEGLSFVNPDMASSVTFSSGGFESKYGDKLSSVLDVQYNKPKKFAGTATMSFMGAAIHVEDEPGEQNRFSYVFGARYRTLQYVLNTLDVGGDYRPRFTDIQGLFSFKINSKLTATWYTTFAQNNYLIVPESRQTNFGTVQSAVRLFVAFGGSELTEYSTWLNAGTLEYRFSERTKLKFISSTYRSIEKEHFTIEGAYRLEELENNLGSDNFAEARALLGVGYFINHGRNDLDIEVNNYKLIGTHYFNPRNSIEFGGKYQTENIHDKLREWNYNDSAGHNASKLPSGPGEIVVDDFLATKIQLESHRITSYIQNKIVLDVDREMRLNIGIRSHYWSVNQQNVISPRVNFSIRPNNKFNSYLNDVYNKIYRLHEVSIYDKDSLQGVHPELTKNNLDSLLKRDWIFKAAFGYYFQPPFYRELRNINGVLNINLRAQRSIHFVVGGDLNFTAWNRPFRLLGEVYFKKLDDLVPYTINNVKLRYDAINSSQGYVGGFDMRVNGEFIRGLESWVNFSMLSARENIQYTDDNGMKQETGLIRRPTDQRVNFAISFQDELPSDPSYKMHLNLIIASALPYYFNGKYRYEERFEIPAYRRVDIGFSKELIDFKKDAKNRQIKNFNSLWLSLEVFNLLQVNNTASYFWVEDLNNNLYGVPNYLTGRRLNLKLIGRF
ncbi:MAG: hypothetical protein ACI8ZN_000127 [Bacteroidia bacterium]|jgi:hypothetical protein